MELIKAMAKFLVVSVVAVAFLWSKADEFLGLGTQSLALALQNGAWLIGTSCLVVSSTLILIAAIDVPFQLWDHSQKLKMTLQEVRDEMKDTEGKPEVKSRVRQVQQEMAQRRMMEAVPEADVIITNPTHYAIALKYDHDNMAAPLVLAMGKDLIALKIREIAAFHAIEIFEAPPLARALRQLQDRPANPVASLFRGGPGARLRISAAHFSRIRQRGPAATRALYTNR